MDEIRQVILNSPSYVLGNPYKNNFVTTAKYNVWTFLPKFLLEQFLRLANFYFLVISIIQMSSAELAPTGQYYTFIPLMVILTLTAFKELAEDYVRHKQDSETNSKNVTVISEGTSRVEKWENLRVGEIVKVENKALFPADLLLLSSSEEEGTCYVETSSLDGETNLKMKKGPVETSKYTTNEDVSNRIKGTLSYESPNSRIYHFEGSLKLDNHEKKIPIGIDQVLLRGSSLRNTQYIYGLVIYTGHDSKIMMNAKPAPIKRSRMEHMVNKQIMAIFVLLFSIAIICLTFFILWNNSEENQNAWYLYLSSNSSLKSDAIQNLKQFVIFVVMFNTVVPISLYVSIEFVKLIQAYFINNDLDMYYEEGDATALARTSNLNEELGQVEYIFSDKTGTLTRNQMQFKKCSIGGTCYGLTVPTKDTKNSMMDEDREIDGIGIVGGGGEIETKPRISLTTLLPESEMRDPSYDFRDPNILENMKPGHPKSNLIHEFLEILALCHTVVAEVDHSQPDKVVYRASSPDELSLIAAGKHLGYRFHGRKSGKMFLKTHKDEIIEYQLLNVLEFDSTRKRMSVIVKTPENKILLYVKGADSVIFDRLSNVTQEYLNSTQDHLLSFATEGLRTLCIAKKELTLEEYTIWANEYLEASNSLVNRSEKMNQVAEKIETNLTLLGATAIEDKLQEGVPEAIKDLLEASIKVWMLTGDKKETAVNIGRSCGLITHGMQLIICEGNSMNEVKQFLENELSNYKLNVDSSELEIGLIIDGKTLVYALEEECKKCFVELAILSKVCICCRVSPMQKAEIVISVKNALNCRTLAIGDGGNDVSMIQSADVGIGINGLEGLQAARAADYAIGQFRFLTKLLFVHGAWSYQRLSKLILYSFYKTLTLYLVSFYFTFENGFSGQIPWDKLSNAGWNMFYTSLPIIALGLFEQQLPKEKLLMFPGLYKSGIQNEFFSLKTFFGWFINSIFHSVLIYLLVAKLLYSDSVFSDNGGDIELYTLGTVLFTSVLLTVTGKIALSTSYWTIYNHILTWGSFLFYIVVIALCGTFYISFYTDAQDLYLVWNRLFSSPQFYLSLVLVTMTCLLRDFSWKFFKRTFHPKDYHIVQEMSRKVSIRHQTSEKDSLRVPLVSKLTSSQKYTSLP